MSIPDFLIWHCAGCGVPAEGKKKPCSCATNVGTREGPNGTREQTWWDDPAPESEAPKWTCFHCGETFTESDAAADHFGWTMLDDPACRLNQRENGLAGMLRIAQAELMRYREEDTDLHRKIAAMAADHGMALRREEEIGYARGLRDRLILEPIGNAPQDGTWILGWSNRDSAPYRVSWGKNHNGELAWCTQTHAFVAGYLTHWMPLPSVSMDSSRG